MDKPIHGASTTIVSSSSQSYMVDPDWIRILGKQRLPCLKGKVTVYVTCQCSENRCLWRVIDHKYQGPCCVALCTVLTASYNPQHTAYNLIMYSINNFLGLCRHFARFLRDNKSVHRKQTTLLKFRIRNDCLLVDDSYEISRSVFSLKSKQYITKVCKLHSAICHDRRFEG